MEGDSYQDYFPSTRQKLAAFRLWRKWATCRSTHENLVYFLCNARPRLEFLEFCAKEEGAKSIEEYLEMTGCGLRIEDVPELYLEYQAEKSKQPMARRGKAKPRQKRKAKK